MYVFVCIYVIYTPCSRVTIKCLLHLTAYVIIDNHFLFLPILSILRQGQLQRSNFMVNIVKDVDKYSSCSVFYDEIVLKCVKYNLPYNSLA